MPGLTGTFIARAKLDAAGQLLEAQDPLAALQYQCGGSIPGAVAIPELRDIVAESLALDGPKSQGFSAFDGENLIEATAQIAPLADGKAILLGISSWQSIPYDMDADPGQAQRQIDVDCSLAELTARLDPAQAILAAAGDAADIADTVAAMNDAAGTPWTDFVTFPRNSHRQPLHWRLLDGAICAIKGSERDWCARLLPVANKDSGFELYLVPQQVLAAPDNTPDTPAASITQSIGRELAPVLRQPIARIIANAETIRTRMAGPISDEYSAYAADIAAAGQHLLSLIEDLTDLEVVEAEDFTTAPDQIDLGDVARRAAGILSVRAQEKNIVLIQPDLNASVPATAEFRRVLQILLNLVGNAIRYAPDQSRVVISIAHTDAGAQIAVSDEGPGLDEQQQALVFEKFERLGRGGDGGSGLGLYISRQIARALGGELRVESEPGKGARFILDLPPEH
ncbi:MAG: HAMP domain-containing sensor histidine kinase [Parerythrobacter sp.]